MRKKLDTRFPAARIKKIMQADEDVGKIALAVPVLVSKSLELFLQDLCDRTYEITLERGAKTVSSLHLKHCVERYNVFDFLREVVSKVPDYGHAQGHGDVTMDDRTISKRRKPISDEVNDSDEEYKKSKTQEIGNAKPSGRGVKNETFQRKSEMALSRLSLRSNSFLKPAATALPTAIRRHVSTDTSPITIETAVPFTAHLCDAPSRSVETSSEEILSFFRDMARMRRMEIAADSLYKAKLIRGFCHLYDGQEALAVGMEAAITRKDAIITSYRDHCTFLGRGGELVDAFSELMGRKRGCSNGKGGSMHFYKKDASFYGGHGIVGAQIPLGCGLAFAQKYSKEENVTFTLYGDGAANQGQLFEALNIAALWDLPAILVCENNHYGMGTATWRSAKSPAYFKRGDYVPGLKVDGMDALAVKQACKFAKEHALKNGPIILEMDTYRYHGHSMSDPGSTYRTRDEISGVRQVRDPIERVRKLLLTHDIATEKELKDMEKEVRKEVDDAVAQAKESPVPEPSELFTNMYVKDCGVESFGADRKELKVTLP